MTYFEVVVDVDSEVLDDDGADGVAGAGDTEGVAGEDWVREDSVRVVVVSVLPGDADGAGAGVTRSRSVTRSLRSVHPAMRPTPSTSAHSPVSNFCMMVPPRWNRTRGQGLQPGCRRAAA